MAEYIVVRKNPKDPQGKYIRIIGQLYGDGGRRLATGIAVGFNESHRQEFDGNVDLQAFVMCIPGVC